MLPPICEALGMKALPVGGWMFSSLKRLKENSAHKFAVATVYSGKDFITQEIDGIKYYLLPLDGKNATDYNKHLESLWADVKESFKPDVVHIHGSEYPHGLAYVRACGARGVVVSLQGIISSYARYYAAGINYKSVKKCLTFRDFIKGGILDGQRSFEKRGKLEIELLQKVGHIIGRTAWDLSHAWAINPKATYHYCGETLRDSFYKNKWDYNSCIPHSIFVSQANYPIKGLHMLLKSMPLVLREYPDAKIYVAGGNPTALPWWRITSYGKYLKELIRKLGIEKNVIFTGSLDEEDMCERYLKSNVFVCCSSIENSPNSLGEAQLLGVPCIASYVGGVADMIPNTACGTMYRFEETSMLADAICDVFANSEKFDNSEMRKEASRRHDAKINANHLLDIYSGLSPISRDNN